MILATHGIISSISGFDPSYQAVLNYATSLGYTLPSSGQSAKQNKLVVDLKAAGIWNKLDTFGVFATDGSSNFALIDWKRVSLYTAVNSPTFTASSGSVGGFRGNGTSSYIDANFIPLINGVNLTLNSASFGWYQYQAKTTINQNENTWGASQDLYLRTTTPPRLYMGSGFTQLTTFVLNNIQFAHFNRTSATNINAYSNGTLLQSSTQLTPTLSPNPFYAFRSLAVYNNPGVSIVFAGANLTAEAAAFNTAINTYLTSL
jgi:hypothetical protein